MMDTRKVTKSSSETLWRCMSRKFAKTTGKLPNSSLTKKLHRLSPMEAVKMSNGLKVHLRLSQTLSESLLTWLALQGFTHKVRNSNFSVTKYKNSPMLLSKSVTWCELQKVVGKVRICRNLAYSSRTSQIFRFLRLTQACVSLSRVVASSQRRSSNSSEMSSNLSWTSIPTYASSP